MPDTSTWTVHTLDENDYTEAFTGKISPDGRTFAMVFADNFWYQREKTNTVWAQSKAYIHTAQNIVFDDSNMTITFDYNGAGNDAYRLVQNGSIGSVCPNWTDQLKNAIVGSFNDGAAYCNLQPGTYFVDSGGKLVAFGHYKKADLAEQIDWDQLTTDFSMWGMDGTGSKTGQEVLSLGLRTDDSWQSNILSEIHVQLGL
jgi:hypothetical protein